MHNKKGLYAISPMIFFLGLFLFMGWIMGSFSNIPLIIVFLLSSIYALFTMHGVKIEDRISCFSRGAGSPNLLLMVWIFILAGSFAQITKNLGAIDVAVNLTLAVFPSNWLIPCLFISACIISLCIGTSVGTIVALVPVVSGIASKLGIDASLLVATIVGGSFFGDNLSFISDTTIAATRTQGCKSLKDKFKANIQITLLAAFITVLFYIVSTKNLSIESNVTDIQSFWKIIPYLFVLIAAIIGINVLLVLLLGIVISVCLFPLCSIPVAKALESITTGTLSMSELILISMLAGGLLEVIRSNGGIDYLIQVASMRIKGKRSAEYCIALLVGVTNLCTANNTVAILAVGDLARQISEKFHVDRRMSASILDIFSCVVQGLIPYGAQILMASGLAGINPLSILPYLYYPVILGCVTIVAIAFRFPKKYYRDNI